ncbi:HD-GYP domain protein [Serpentinimonas raichei]|uniref:HD-GYP domain protein n=1 Tax=Serpentinimonas raichei TaxID=1458425 RepID=A0A060NIA7_9BURK|nr:HD-GYP domain-containing protein [Serpentinimonas raichei]BAO81786.1 HD-GYP domain protein [Serpentinimonas raichei]
MPKPKLKKIPVRDVRLGMYIEAFCGSWMDHPFWRSKFVITDAHELHLVHECAITEVLIDVSLGLDVLAPPATAEAAGQPQTPAVPQPPPVPDTEAATMRAEYQRAAAICKAATGAVRHMFAEVRMGRAIDQEVARQVAEEITDSVLRNGGALISLARLKTADGYTYMHSVAVCALMVALARQLGLSEAETRAAGFAGLMHDLGKADVPLEMLNKPGRLTEDEFAQVRLHPEHGHRRLLAAGVDDPIALDVCLHHHERIDGKGYPKQLAGEAISRMARMGAVCDVYDAITSNRPYKEGWDPAESLAKMAQWTNGHLDPAIFQALVRSLGIYPTGSLVRLSNGKLALVVEQSGASLLKPIVKTVYSTLSHERVVPQRIDLSAPGNRLQIEKRENPKDWQIPDLDALWMDELAQP